MADVYTVTFILIGMLLSLPLLLVGVTLLLPGVTKRVETRLAETPGRSFFLGVPITAAFALWVAITAQASFGPLRAAAFMAVLAYAGLGTVGAAGMARVLARRLRDVSQTQSELAHLLRGAVVYEFACFFPIVGWFLFAPLVGVTVVGAAVFALLKWLPRPAVSVGQAASVVSPQ